MGSDNLPTIIFALIFSLAFSSVAITYFLLSIYGVSVSGIILPTSLDTYSSSQNFIEDSFNSSTIDSSTKDAWVYVKSIGFKLLNNGLWSKTYLLINNIQPAETITNTYVINNSVLQNYGIVIRYTNSLGKIVVEVENDGFHIKKYGALFLNDVSMGEMFFYPYPDANQNAHPTILTVYNENEGTLSYYVDGNIIFKTESLTDSDFSFSLGEGSLFHKFYGGVVSNTVGFVVESFNSQNIISKSESALSQIAAFLVTLLKILVYNVDSKYLPNELNFIFIKTQLVGLLACIASYIRG